jgi:hypothetical protein
LFLIFFWTFYQSSNPLCSISDETTNFKRKSGEPGYDFGKPLLAAKNVSEPELEVDPRGPRLWTSTDPTSLCRHSSLKKIEFLKDSQSGCLLELSKANFTNCQDLKNQIRSIQAQLVQSTDQGSSILIAKGGNPENMTLEDHIEMLFEDETKYDHSDNETNIISSCTVPSHLHYEVLYTNAKSKIYRYVSI